jgi:hypothetical protein
MDTFAQFTVPEAVNRTTVAITSMRVRSFPPGKRLIAQPRGAAGAFGRLPRVPVRFPEEAGVRESSDLRRFN